METLSHRICSFSAQTIADLIPPYLFILCAEVLSLMLRKKNAIKRIDMNNKSYLLSQYTDDIQIF